MSGAATILVATMATTVAVVALLLIPVSIVVGHPFNVVGEAIVLVLCVAYVGRVMRADRRRRREAEALLPPTERGRRGYLPCNKKGGGYSRRRRGVAGDTSPAIRKDK